MNIASLNTSSSRLVRVRRTALAIAIVTGFGLSGQVLAQATTSTIFGQAPLANGETVQIIGGSGFDRTVPVDNAGRYTLTVPVGTYTVNLLQNGKIIQSKTNVTPSVAGATAVNFTAGGNLTTQNLSTVTVTTTAIPAIDIASTRESTVITAEQLKQLPLARSAAAIALLAPGTVQGAGLLGNGPLGEPLVSFGGASVAENAYYINGFNTSDPLGNSGGISLPYGSIEQQATLTSGYGAEYGRSTGGVISQVGKSGTNDWHFGAQTLWSPAFAQSNYVNYHFDNPLSQVAGQEPGDVNAYNNKDKGWETVYDAYVSGPLIKDKLFFFLSAEKDNTQNNTVQLLGTNQENFYKNSKPKLYAKLDWNINDSNILSLTGIENKNQQALAIAPFSYTTHSVTGPSASPLLLKNSFRIWIAKYTSYITDNLTLNAMYGKMEGTYYAYAPTYTLPSILNPQSQNPAYNGGNPYSNNNPTPDTANPAHTSTTTNLRLDLDWKLGQHDIKFGIDNMNTADLGAGSIMTGPGYAWEYDQSSNPTQPIQGTSPSQAPYVAPVGNYPNGAEGYYAAKYTFITSASVRVAQRAQYAEDDWQVTSNLLLDLGLRNDQFTNYNPDNVPYVRLTSPNWAPRLGFSWDVFGDSSLKVYGNAGRYYLSLPAGVALREASASTYTRQYFTYTGIDANGIPTGLTPIFSNPVGGTSANNEYGEPLDPNTVRSTNLKAEYQDEFVLGMQQQISPSWVYSVQGLYRTLGRVIDDTGDTTRECIQLLAQNLNVPGVDCSNLQASVLINPGDTNRFQVANDLGGYNYFTMSPSQADFPAESRKYYALEAYLEHPFDGKWTGKIDYVFSKSYGSTEGPVQSNIGQGGNSVSATTQWDYGELMSYANGVQANSRRHVLKAYGTYQIAPEWSVSAVLTVAAGLPKSCLGYFGPDQTNPNLGYGSFYHWCGGTPAPSGSTGYTPWIHPLDLSVVYRPSWAGKKLAFQIQIHNVFNEQKMLQQEPLYGSTVPVAGPNPLAGVITAYGSPAFLSSPTGTEAPRYVQFGATYDF